MHHLVRHHLHNSKYIERTNMYWAMALKSFAISLVGVFVPAYLYTLGYSLQGILFYFLLREGALLVLVLPVTALMSRIGVKQTLVAGCAFALINLVLLYMLPNNHNVFVAAAVSEGLAICTFFLPYHFIFSSSITKENANRQIGFMYILVSIVTAAGPLIGGFAASFIQVQSVFLLAIFFALLGVIPLLKTINNSQKVVWSLKNSLKMISSKDAVSCMGFGVTEMAATVIWPLFIFLLVTSYLALGIVVSASLVLIVFLDVIVGRLSDKGRGAALLSAGSRLSSVVHSIRFVASSTMGALVMNTLSDVTHTLFRIPWTTAFYEHANIRERGSYIASMELSVCMSRLVFWILLIVSGYYLTSYQTMIFAFFLGAVGSLYVTRINTARTS